ncbi:hypothetical protein lerEdw1_015708 [Lerista edwardsae]|nr:hypothetical protein lerEdw1_015708 [Lerista edwardsae]
MSRQAYFYRVPPQELHRRTQLQPEPAKTKALQTVIEMKKEPSLCIDPAVIFQDTKIASLERNIRDLEDEIQMLKTNGVLNTEDREEEIKQIEVYKSHSKFMKNKIDQLKQELSKKESELLALQTKLETLSNQNSDCKQHIEVLKESLTAKEQRAAILQTEFNIMAQRAFRQIGLKPICRKKADNIVQSSAYTPPTPCSVPTEPKKDLPFSLEASSISESQNDILPGEAMEAEPTTTASRDVAPVEDVSHPSLTTVKEKMHSRRLNLSLSEEISTDCNNYDLPTTSAPLLLDATCESSPLDPVGSSPRTKET